MSVAARQYEGVVIGAGYYGCRLALHLCKALDAPVLLYDRANAILGRASYVNQARVHGGYHYPRALDTALTSRRFFERFLSEHSEAITWNTLSVYAIAQGSKVSPRQFELVCQEIGARLSPAPSRVSSLFDARLIDASYLAEEFAFNAKVIKAQLDRRLEEADSLTVTLGAPARILGRDSSGVELEIAGERVHARYVLNCTYSDLDSVGVKLRTPLRKELAEIAIIRPPGELSGYSVTVMDGPFFSTLPFPALNAYSLTHVRFTPVTAWLDGGPPDARFPLGFARSRNGEAMIRDSARYLPALGKAAVLGSLYDVKTVMLAREDDDGRPILFEESHDVPGVISILGSKVDNIYDAIDALDSWLGSD